MSYDAFSDRLDALWHRAMEDAVLVLRHTSTAGRCGLGWAGTWRIRSPTFDVFLEIFEYRGVPYRLE